ncbi:hypothetical protein C8J56DRAFT_1061812 [Mycena floridula]|nr:hypothetical protein C8J56DRAFT_1061812 [Mycena floridula]
MLLSNPPAVRVPPIPNRDTDDIIDMSRRDSYSSSSSSSSSSDDAPKRHLVLLPPRRSLSLMLEEIGVGRDSREYASIMGHSRSIMGPLRSRRALGESTSRAPPKRRVLLRDTT